MTEVNKPPIVVPRSQRVEKRLHEARAVLKAVQHGDVDAVVITDQNGRERVYTLETDDHPYRALIEQIQEGTVTLGANGTILYCNRFLAELLGVPQERVIGKALRQFVARNDTAVLQRMLNDAVTAPVRQELGLETADGAQRPVYLSLSPLRHEDGHLLCGVLTDLTQQKIHLQEMAAAVNEARATNDELNRMARHFSAAKTAAEQASRAKTRFLAAMSHELRTPLNGILGYAQLLRIDGGLTERQSQRVEAMLTAGTHLLEMISCVLDLSEIETVGVALQPVAINLRTLLDACLNMLVPAAETKGLSLRLSLRADVPRRIVIDPSRLRQILLNFLGNAVKFTLRGSVELRVRTRSAGTRLRFEVIDTGPGIDPVQQDRLFGEFTRLCDGDSNSVEGAGLGLLLAKQLSHLMRGQIGHDDNPGGGSIFWLELPAEIDREGTGAARAADFGARAAQPRERSQRNKRVLIADDVAMNRDIAAAFIQAEGYEVVCADGGEAAVTAASEGDFAVILMDVRMPGLDGLEATRRIRALDGPRRHVPVVALTAQVFTEQISACQKAGMDFHLTKPFTPETLRAAIDRGIEAARLRGASDAPAAPDANAS